MDELFNKLDLKKIFNRAMSYAVTEFGKNLILNETPLLDVEDAKKSLDLTYSIKCFLEEVGEVSFFYLPDIRDAIYKSRIENFILPPKDILQIGKLLYNSRLIRSSIGGYKQRFPTIWELVSELKENLFLEKKINDVFDDYGEVKDSASDDLRRIRNEIKTLQFQIQKINENILKALSKEGMVQDEIITLRDGRMVIPVRSEFKRKVKGFIHAESATGQTTYIEPAETLELNNELLSLFFEEKREINRILDLLTKDISKFSDVLLNNLEIISKFDSHYAKAKYAIEIRGNKINFSEDGSFDLIDAKHPLLIQTIGFQKTVPFSLKIDGNIRGIVISGPNAGGKTVLMKTIGIFSILSKMGYLLPAEPDSKIPFFKKVFIDIGDDQSIDDDISTFGSHIRNLKYIYENCDENSLILLDELGAGTDPVQGAALAASVIDEFINKNSFLVVTTHHSFLKFFAANHQKLINASMEFDSKTLEPTYRFNQGIPGSSYTFEIAKRMNFAQKIIEGAKKYLKRSDIQMENYIAQLQQKIQQYTQLITTLKKEKEETQKIKSEFESKLSKIKNESKEIKRKAALEAEQILKTANKIVENTIRDLRESKADKQTINRVKQYLAEEKDKLNKLLELTAPKRETIPDEIKKGDLVRLEGQESFGTVISIDKKKKQAVVQIEQFKITVSIDKISRASESKDKLDSALFEDKIYHPVEIKTLPLRLDIRGKRSSEAEEMILKYIDEAVIYGLFDIEILHGKGDGVLKNLTHKLLQSHPFVESFQFAPVEQGGEGITRVKLRD